MNLNRTARRIGAAALALLLGGMAGAAPAPTEHQAVLEARDALRAKDAARLARALDATATHELAPWVQYWELSNRLISAKVADVEAFYARWPGTYVEDRLRNDWLLELGRRRDWAAFSRDFPRFRMNDDREVTCYWLLTQYFDGKDVLDAAREAWFAQRDADDGCDLLASYLYTAGQLRSGDVWQKARLAIEAGRPAAARDAAALISAEAGAAVAELAKNPARYLARDRAGPQAAELATLALMRLSGSDLDAAVVQLQTRWQKVLPSQLAALAWASAGRQAALKLQTDALDHYRRANAAWREAKPAARALAPWTRDMLTWQVRAALRHDGPAQRHWALVAAAIDALPEDEQQDPTWVYWRARAWLQGATQDNDAEARRTDARRLLASIAGQMHFYGKLAAEELGETIPIPGAPAPLSQVERAQARLNPGLSRALLLIDIGLRSEGVREWNFTLRGMGDRELLAAAQWACERQVWDRCINTSDRTKGEVDLAQRFPTPFRQEVVQQAQETGVDAAYVYGLIRQESRFVMDARSSVGASGLMQLMPATARWTAKKIGVPYKGAMITDRDMNLRLGTSYLKLVLDDFEGSRAMATAAYNAGPSRPRRWRDGPLLEPAAWAENIPFAETRDYVKKVLSNSVYYHAVLTGQVVSLKSVLGPPIGPRDARTAEPDAKLP